MDKRLLQYYERELRYIRELRAEFAQRFPKVAGRLGIHEHGGDDPHVERLFQGFSLMAARVHERLDAEAPRLTDALLDQVCPNHLAGTPSMVIVQLHPDTQQGSLDRGYEVPTGSTLRTRSNLWPGATCEYRTAHPVRLWPITLETASYTGVLRELDDVQVATRQPIKALLRLRLHARGGRTFSQLGLSSLPIHLHGADETTGRLYEALMAQGSALIGRWSANGKHHAVRSNAFQPVRSIGFDDAHALLPLGSEALRGHRLLQEYFALPSRYHFVELQGLEEAVRRCEASTLDLYICLNDYDPALEGMLDPQQLVLYATPAINLFPRTCDLLRPDVGGESRLLIPDRARPTDLEIHSVQRVTATVAGSTHERELHPIWSTRGRLDSDGTFGHYELERKPRVVSYEEHQRRPSSARYPGVDVFVRLQGQHGLAKNEQLRVRALCTNRDLPLALGQGKSIEFTMPNAGPVRAVRCIAGPTAPYEHERGGDANWSLISHLSENYLALCDPQSGGQALRELLSVYGKLGSLQLQREIEGVRSAVSAPMIGPVPGPGPQKFARGLEIKLTCEESAFAGHRAFLLASVLSEFFARHASASSFSQTVLHSSERGEIHRWPAIAGVRSVV